MTKCNDAPNSHELSLQRLLSAMMNRIETERQMVNPKKRSQSPSQSPRKRIVVEGTTGEAVAAVDEPHGPPTRARQTSNQPPHPHPPPPPPAMDNPEPQHPVWGFTKAIAAAYTRLRARYGGARTATKQLLAARWLGSTYTCKFSVVVIPARDIDQILRPMELGGGESISDRTIDLSFLRGLKLDAADEKFLTPDRIYVRDCMRTIFALFRADVEQTPRRAPDMAYAAALIGSPGVGKSILFFLAALFQAKTSTILYYRRTRRENVSLFCMGPTSDRTGVRVWFSRNVERDAVDCRGGVLSLNVDVRGFLGLRRSDAYIFVDGPLHSDNPNHMHHNYDYFCSSGGMPPFASEETTARRWVLDGWTKEESIEWLVAFQMHRDGTNPGDSRNSARASFSSQVLEDDDDSLLRGYCDNATKAYWCCGGNMREMLTTLETSGSLGNVKGQLNDRMNELGANQIRLALSSTVRGTKSSDRLRTMFWERDSQFDPRFRMAAKQVVDSEFVLTTLRKKEKLQTDDIMTTYRDLQTSNIRAPQGCLFELIIHQFITSNQNLPYDDAGRFPAISSVCWSEGSLEQSVEDLSGPGVFWIPSKQNFPNIGSALVYGTTLYSLQMTISRTHTFKRNTFQAGFISTLKNRITFEKAVVYFLHPLDVNFSLPRRPPRQSVRLRSEGRDVPLEFKAHGVNMGSFETLNTSLMRLFEHIHTSDERSS